MTCVLRFSINGLAGRPGPIDYELHPDVNVFFGPNGSGKTTLLRVIYSALSNSSQDLTGVSVRSARVEFSSTSHRREYVRTLKRRRETEVADQVELIEIDGEFLQLPITTTLTRPGSDWLTRPKGPRSDARFASRYLSTWRLTTAALGSGSGAPARTQGLPESNLDEVFASQVRQLWRRFTNKSLSEVRLIQQDGLAKILRTLFDGSPSDPADRRTADIDVRHAYERANGFLLRQGAGGLGTFGRFNRRYTDDPNLQRVVGQIDAIERRIERAEEPRRQLAELVARLFGNNKVIEFTDRDIDVASLDGQPIPLSSLSAGEKHLLRIALDVLNAGDSTILIDEPELSLHIDWQHNLLSDLGVLNPSAQFIVATHSPEIMALTPEDRIFAL